MTTTVLFVGYTNFLCHSERTEEDNGACYQWSEQYSFSVDYARLSAIHNTDFETFGIPAHVTVGETVYVLSITFSDGDSFGTASGKGEVLWVFKNKDVAEKAYSDWNSATDDNKPSVEFVIDDGSKIRLSNPVGGYFKNIGELCITKLTVQ